MNYPDYAAELRFWTRLLTAVAALLALRLMTSEEFAVWIAALLKGD